MRIAGKPLASAVFDGAGIDDRLSYGQVRQRRRVARDISKGPAF